MEQRGFGQRWRDIMALIWSSTSSRILLNGEAGRPIKHGRGLRQGDPLSLLLFILAIDPFQKLIDMTTEAGLLHPIGVDPVRLRMSLYANDTVLFIRPIGMDMDHLHQLLQSFGAVMRVPIYSSLKLFLFGAMTFTCQMFSVNSKHR
jgi:hypothetical protein